MLQQVPSAYPDPWCPTFRYVDCHYPRVAAMVSLRQTRGITADTHQWPLLAGASPSRHPHVQIALATPMPAREAPRRARRPRSARRSCAQQLQRYVDTRGVDRHLGELQPHLYPGERSDQGQVVEMAEVADPEYPPGKFAQAGAERHVEAVQDDVADLVGVVFLRQQHRRH